MGNERLIPNIPLKLLRSFRSGYLISRLRPWLGWNYWIGWQQWLVLFSLGAAVMVIELRNHKLMWQEHQSGQTILTDPMLIWEMILFGLVLPILAGIVLGHTGRTAIERDHMAKALELRRALIAQMHRAQSWHELAELIVTTPGNIVPADRSWLLAKRSDDEEFNQIAQWKRPALGQLPSSLKVTPAVCERCSQAQFLRETRIVTCNCPEAGISFPSCIRHCLWLATEDNGKAVLLIDVPPEQPLSKSQIKVLDDLGDEMSLAIENANLNYEKQRQGDIALNIRQRIARDLHDTLGQNISYLRLKLGQLSDDQLDPGRIEFQNELANMLKVADEAYEQVRDTLEELRAPDFRDLEETVRLYATQVGARTGFFVNVYSSGQPGTMSVRKSRQMMYILREALNNVEKHSYAQNVDIQLLWSEDEFIMTVNDDGIGFHLEEINTEERYGMTIMGERSRAINAKLAVNSTLGEGTEIRLRVPLSSIFAAANG